MNLRVSRRNLAAAAALLPIACSRAGRAVLGSAPPASTSSNPLVRQRADAQVVRHEDGQYYLMATAPEYDRLIIRRSATLAGLGDPTNEAVVWRRPASGRLAGHIWAPELHWFDGTWHIYFAAGDGDEPFRIRTYVMACRDLDPISGRWSVLGELETLWDTFTLDATLFVHCGVRYACWAQQEPGIDTNSNIYLAPLATATTLARAPVRLTVPTFDWEIAGYKVNEGPALLARNGALFLTYSAAATDARYCLGMLTAADDADIMDPRAWTKSPEPVFQTCRETSVYGPGHNSFTLDEQGRDILVYHGRDYEKIVGDPLFDHNRHTRIQRLHYDAQGCPDFGVPVGNGALPERFAVAGRSGVWLAHEGVRPYVGSAPLPQTQFRSAPAAAGGLVLSPILLPDHCLTIGPDASVRISPRTEAISTSGANVFNRVPAGRNMLRFEAHAYPGKALAGVAGALCIAPSGDESTLWSIG